MENVSNIAQTYVIMNGSISNSEKMDFNSLKEPDKWKCEICNAGNYKTEKCIICEHYFGSWKCDRCGFVIDKHEYYGAMEICICPNCLFDMTEDKFVTQKEFDEAYEYYNDNN